MCANHPELKVNVGETVNVPLVLYVREAVSAPGTAGVVVGVNIVPLGIVAPLRNP